MTQISGVTSVEIKYDDAAWESLVDIAELENKRKIADEKTARLSKEDWLKLRRRAKTDLFFLGQLLGYDRLTVGLHGHMCRWHEATIHERFREWLLPRGHFKSTLLTVIHGIQLALPDDVGDCVYPANLGPNIRILIAHEVVLKASDFLYEIAQHFMGNPELMALFPECVPTPKKHKINKSEFELAGRTQKWKEATFDTMGVGGKSQGAHYNYLKLDDLIGDKARDSETEMATAKQWLDNIQAFFSLFKKDKFDLIGTRYANDDIYDHMEERYGPKLRVYRRKVEEPVVVNGKKQMIYNTEKAKMVEVVAPIFPEEYDTESLDILRKNRKVFSAQYENDPDSGSTKFDEDDFRYFKWLDKTRISTIEIAHETGRTLGVVREKIYNLNDLGICFILDPAPTHEAGFTVIGTATDRKHFILEAVQQPLDEAEVADFVFRKNDQYRPRAVGIEEVLFSRLYKPWFEAEMKLRGKRFNIQLLKAGATSKGNRVLSLGPYLSAHEIYLNDERYTIDEQKQESHLIYQLKKFGSIKHYHVLDTLGYLGEIAKPGFSRENHNKQRASEDARFAGRDPVTGYSKTYDRKAR